MTVSIKSIKQNADDSVSITGSNLDLPYITVLAAGYISKVLFRSYHELIFALPKAVGDGIHTIMLHVNALDKIYYSNSIDIEIIGLRTAGKPLPVPVYVGIPQPKPVNSESESSVSELSSESLELTPSSLSSSSSSSSESFSSSSKSSISHESLPPSSPSSHSFSSSSKSSVSSGSSISTPSSFSSFSSTSADFGIGVMVIEGFPVFVVR